MLLITPSCGNDMTPCATIRLTVEANIAAQSRLARIRKAMNGNPISIASVRPIWPTRRIDSCTSKKMN